MSATIVSGLQIIIDVLVGWQTGKDYVNSSNGTDMTSWLWIT